MHARLLCRVSRLASEVTRAKGCLTLSASRAEQEVVTPDPPTLERRLSGLVHFSKVVTPERSMHEVIHERLGRARLKLKKGRPSYLPADPEEVGSARASQSLDLAFDRNRAVRNALADWTEHCEHVSIPSTLTVYTDCAEYDTLLDFGPSIVPHVMLQYAYDVKVDRAEVARGGAHGIGRGVLFWYELLHELVFGRKTGMMTVVFPDVYKWWETWFQERPLVEGAIGGGDGVAA